MTEPRWRLLIADDNPDDRALIQGALLRGSAARTFRFVEAGSVAEALARVRDDPDPFQALLVDYTLPDGTAFDLLAGLPREPEGPGMLPLLLPAPVVVVTGRGDGELGARLLRAGATDFVGKDWLGPGSVTRAVENAIERHAMAAELRARQRALHESESRSRTIFEHATTGIAIIDAGGHYLRCNAAYSAITGLSEEELRHREFPALLHAEERERNRAHMQQLLAGAIPSYELDGRFVRQDGSVRWVHKFVSVLDMEDGRPHELISLVTDVTARRAAEAELRERDEAARLVADTAARLVLGNAGGTSTEEVLSSTFRVLCRRVGADCYLHYTLEADGTLQLVSSVGVDLAAHPEVARLHRGEQLCGQVLARGAPLVLEEPELADCQLAIPGLRAYAGYPIAAEDRVFGVLAVASWRRGRFRTGELDLIATLADLVAAWLDRARLTRALREREERLALFIAHAPAALAMFDRDLRCLAASHRYLSDYALDRHQLAGRPHHEVSPALGPAWREAHRRALRGEVVRSEGDPYRTPAGETRWVRWEVRPWVDGRDEVGGIILATEDVTEERRLTEELRLHREELQRLVEERTGELEASHRRLRASERMASLGTLSAGLGHDMGNLLMPMRVRLDTLQALDLPGEVHRELDGIRASASYLQRLASGLRLLAVDPQQAAQERALEVGRWWREAEAVLRNILPRGTLLEAELPDDPCWVRISTPALTQAVFNLVQNAGDALKGLPPGTVTVALEPCGAEVLVRVTDTGPGMSAEVQQRCMEPFFTTKARGISTGLGLALVYGLVQEAGGVVELRSAPGQGTTFTLRLPRAEPPLGRGGAGRSAYVGMENPRLRAYVAAHLRQRGCEVQDSPAAALTADLLVVEGDAPPGARGRVITLPAAAPFGDVKLALRAALEELDTPMVTT
ncbi:MAG: PAS domain S-box protein [Gemmatimonadetes bacterium]|nr:PAS domain S-box protein [Gemmatimonadota bacterium]